MARGFLFALHLDHESERFVVNFQVGCCSIGCWSAPVFCFLNYLDTDDKLEQIWCCLPFGLVGLIGGLASAEKNPDGTVSYHNKVGGPCFGCCVKNLAWKGVHARHRTLVTAQLPHA